MNFGKVALLALASASMVFMASCKKDEPAKKAPTVEVKTAGGQVLKGAAKEADFALVVEAKPAKDLRVTEINYMITYGGSSSELKKLKLEKSKTLEAWLGKIERKEIPDGVKEGKIKITAIDSDKNQTIKEIDFNFSGAAPTPNPETGWNAEKQGGISHTNGIGKAAYDLKNGKSVTLDNKTAATDRYMMNTSLTGKGFTAAWTSDKVTGIAEPNNKGNGTEFAKIAGDYATITPADAEAAFNAGAKTKDVTGVKENDVYVAKLNTELYIIKITRIDMSNNSARKESDKGCIEFSYKAKK